MKKIVLISLLGASYLFGSSCTIKNYNSATTCSQVESALQSAIAQTEQYFKTTRATNIEAPTRILSTKMEQYSKLVGVLYNYNNAILALRQNVAFLRTAISDYAQKDFAIEKIISDSKKLEGDILGIENELNLILLKQE
jgi:serine kinase of HPr protein (carbohydrate metabolism regulator)